MRPAALLVITCGCAGAGGLGTSTLTAERCEGRRHDAAATLHLRIEPARAHNSSVSLVVFLIRPGSADSLVYYPPPGVDTVPQLPAGTYRVRVRSIGFQGAEDTLRLARGEVWCLTARLARALELQPDYPP